MCGTSETFFNSTPAISTALSKNSKLASLSVLLSTSIL